MIKKLQFIKVLKKLRKLLYLFILGVFVIFFSIQSSESEPSYSKGNDFYFPDIEISSLNSNNYSNSQMILKNSENIKELTEAAFFSFFKNDFDLAQKLFKRALEINSLCIPCLEGLSMIEHRNYKLEDLVILYCEIIKMDPGHPLVEIYLDRLETIGNYASNYFQLIPLFENLIQSPKITPYNTLLIKEYLVNLYQLKGFIDKAAGIKVKLGYINHWDYIIGPLDGSGVLDLNKKYFPEKNEIEGFNSSKVFRDAKTFENFLDFANYIFPQKGVSYAITYFTTNNRLQGVIEIFSDDSLKVWLNEKLVHVTDIYDKTKTQNSHILIPVNFSKNLNQLIIKNNKFGDDQLLAVRLLNKSGNLLDLKETDVTAKYIIPEDSEKVKKFDVNINFGAFDYLKKRKKQFQNDLIVDLFLADFYQNENNIIESEKVLRELCKNFPKSSYISYITALFYFFCSYEYPDSNERFMVLTKEFLDNSLKNDPLNPSAILLLAIYHINVKNNDRGLNLLREYLDINPDDFFPYYCLGLMSKINFQLRETKELFLKALLKNPISKKPYFELAKIYNVLYPSKSLELIQELEKEYSYDPTIFNKKIDLFKKIGDYQKTLETMEKLRIILPDNINTKFEKANLLTLIGDYHEASDMLSAFNPEKTVFPNVALIMADINMLNYSLNDAISFLEKATILNPSDFFSRNRIIYHTQTKEFFEEYDLNLETIEINEDFTKQYSKSDLLLLFRTKILELNRDWSYREFIHDCIKIKTRKGITQINQNFFPNMLEKENVIEMRVILPDDSISYPFNLDQENVILYQLPNRLPTDSIFEYSYTVNHEASLNDAQIPFYYNFIFKMDEVPINFSRFVIIAPLKQQVSFTWTDNESNKETITENDENKIYSFEQKHIQPVFPCDFMPPWEEVYSCLQIYKKPYLESFIEFCSNKIIEIDDSCKAIQDLIDKFKRNYTTRVQIVRDVYDYINSEIHYEYNDLNDKTICDAVILKNGDIYTKTILAHKIFESTGIDSYYTFGLSKRNIDENSKYIIREYNPEIYLALPEYPSGYKWIRFFSGNLPLYSLDTESWGKNVVILKDHETILTNLTEFSIDNNRNKGLFTVEINIEGSSNVEGEIIFDGDFASDYRDIIDFNKSNSGNIVKKFFENLIDGLEITNTKILNIENNDKPLIMEFKGKSAFIPNKWGDKISLPVSIIKDDLQELFQNTSLSNPIFLEFPIILNEITLKYIVPDYFEIINIPDNVMLNDEIGIFSLNINIKEGYIIIKHGGLIHANRIEKDKYKLHQKFIDIVDTCQNQEIELIASDD